MLISGIRHRVKLELDAQRTDVFKVYLLHYLRMFSFLGVIFPILIGVDYFSKPTEKEEKIINKLYVPISPNQVHHYIYTETYRFRCDQTLYNKAYIGNNITFQQTPIFKVYTIVSYGSGSDVYSFYVSNVYGWALIIIVATFVLSALLLSQFLSKQQHIKQDLLINIGIINSLLCCIIVITVLFQKLY